VEERSVVHEVESQASANQPAMELAAIDWRLASAERHIIGEGFPTLGGPQIALNRQGLLACEYDARSHDCVGNLCGSWGTLMWGVDVSGL